MFYRAVIVKEKTNSKTITLRAKSKEDIEEMMPRIKSFLYPDEDASGCRYLIWTHEVEAYSPGVKIPEYQVTVYKPEEKKVVEHLKKTSKDRTIIPLDDEILIAVNLIEKLQKENEELGISNKYTIHLTDKQYNVVIENAQNDINQKWIQKVKDKIEKEIKYHERNILEIENITMLKSKTAKEEAEIEFNKYAIVVLKKILQELIEEREEK